MGVIAEKFADEKGLVWPQSVAPFTYHIIALPDDENITIGQKVYDILGSENCLFDDRNGTSTGSKFADADLIGCPIQIVVSKKTLEQNSVEVISRTGKFDSYMCKISDIKSIVIS
jgi:prolyl-tRNA synthetase